MSSSKALFRPTRQETRADVTDRAAREIIESDANAQQQQIVRLRSARLKKEAAEEAAQQVKPAPKARKKRTEA